ncbi:MAG TPA: PQQ-binding-like beta-propeller repeat protein [Vicinamibacterales bacterium]|nr:PQQ-binding-like beta-propeller repeat protein [Vicinamibacterales bacterium]
MSRKLPAFVSLVIGFVATAVGLSGQAGSSQGSGLPSTRNGEWPHYTADIKGTRYSPLDQVNASNFNKLEVAWRFKTDNLGPFPEYKLEGTPLMVKGVLYTTGGTRRSVIALDAKTGELVWSHSLREGKRAAVAPRQLSGRGVSYWTDGKGDERVVYITTGYRLVELNAKTGATISSFGKDGIVDLKVGAVFGKGQQIDLESGEIGVHSTPAIAKDVVVIGSSMREGATVPTHNNTKGLVRAFDVRSGKLLWTWNTIPKPGEFGNDTWENESWAINGNTGVWTQISIDEELGLVYLPVETPTSDYYGGHRPGNNLFAESLVCVDLKTGQRKWYFQFVHHPIWNFDMSSAPIVADINVAGKAIKAVAVPSKQGWVYVFDRVTGQPVWPIEEKPVPQSDVPGEKTSPTQPFPPDKLRYARNYLNVPDDLIDFTPALRAEALERVKRYKVEPSPFMPAILGNVNDLLGSIGSGTATNWPGGGYDPETHIVYAPAGNTPGSRSLVAPPAGFSDIRYVSGLGGTQFREVLGPGDCCAADSPRTAERAREARAAAPASTNPPAGSAAAGVAAGGAAASGGVGGAAAAAGLTVQGLPIVKPPYGLLAAISLDRGELLWQTPHGDTPDAIRNHPVLRGMNIPKTGQAAISGVGLLVTKTLVIMGDPQVTTTPEHPRGAMLRAYDKATGQQVGAIWMPAIQSGSPMTYSLNGKQYIVVAVSGGNYSGEYLSFSLPDNDVRSTTQAAR